MQICAALARLFRHSHAAPLNDDAANAKLQQYIRKNPISLPPAAVAARFVAAPSLEEPSCKASRIFLTRFGAKTYDPWPPSFNHITDRQLHQKCVIFENWEELDLSNCFRITDKGLYYLPSLERLHTLNLSLCTITDEGLRSVARVESLRNLDLSHCFNVTDEGLFHLAKLERLEQLNLWGCYRVTRQGLQYVSQVRYLQMPKPSLLPYCDMTDEHLHKLCINFITRKNLDLAYCFKVTIEGLRSVAMLTELQHLNLSNCNITDTGLWQVAKLQHLQSLDLSYCFKITGEGLRNVARLTKLRSLNLSGCNITDEELQVIAELKHLESLDLTNCLKITCEGVQRLAGKYDFKRAYHLENDDSDAHVSFTALQNARSFIEPNANHFLHGDMTDEELRKICVSLKGLKKLNLSNYFRITDAGLMYIAMLDQLQELDLSGCLNITDKGLAHLAGLKHLKLLNLQHCYRVTDQGLHHVSHIKHLTSPYSLTLNVEAR